MRVVKLGMVLPTGVQVRRIYEYNSLDDLQAQLMLDVMTYTYGDVSVIEGDCLETENEVANMLEGIAW